MASRGNGLIRWLLALVILTGVAAGFYSFRRQSSSDRIKAEMLAIIDDMELPPAWGDEVEQLILVAHEQAFRKALDVTRPHGQKFDAKAYYDEVLTLVIAWAREDGREQLADRLENERDRFSLRATEH